MTFLDNPKILGISQHTSPSVSIRERVYIDSSYPSEHLYRVGKDSKSWVCKFLSQGLVRVMSEPGWVLPPGLLTSEMLEQVTPSWL